MDEYDTERLTKYIAAVILYIIGLCISLGTMLICFIYGWGMEIKSWGIAIGVYLIGHLIGQGLYDLGKHISKDDD